MNWWDNDPVADGMATAAPPAPIPQPQQPAGNWWEADPVASPAIPAAPEVPSLQSTFSEANQSLGWEGYEQLPAPEFVAPPVAPAPPQPKTPEQLRAEYDANVNSGLPPEDPGAFLAQSLQYARDDVAAEDKRRESESWGNATARKLTKRGLPFISTIMDAARLDSVIMSANKINAGEAGRIDYDNVARWIAETEAASKDGMGSQVADTVAMMPAFMGELMMTGGAFTGARAAVEGGAKKLLGKAAENTAAKAAAKVAATAAASAALSAANPQGVIRSTFEEQLDDTLDETQIFTDETGKPVRVKLGSVESFASALPKGFADATIEVGTEMIGGELMAGAGKLVSKIPGLGKLGELRRGVVARWLGRTGNTITKLEEHLKEVGWNGIIGEALEERAGDVARVATGLQDAEENPTGQLLYEAPLAAIQGDTERALEMQRRAARQLVIEGAAFGVVGGAAGAAEGVANRFGTPQTIQQQQSQPEQVQKPPAAPPAQPQPSQRPAFDVTTAEQWAATNPSAAAAMADHIAKGRSVSRGYLEKVGVPNAGGSSAVDRADFARRVAEHLKQQAQPQPEETPSDPERTVIPSVEELQQTQGQPEEASGQQQQQGQQEGLLSLATPVEASEQRPASTNPTEAPAAVVEPQSPAGWGAVKGDATAPATLTEISPAATKGLASLRKHYAADGYENTDAITPVEPRTDAERDAIEFLRARGREGVFVAKPGDPRFDTFAGMSHRKERGVVFMRSGMQEHTLWRTVGHELAHATGFDEGSKADEDLIRSFAQKRLEKSAPGSKYRVEMEQNSDTFRREGVAELVGSFMSDPQFREQVRASNPNLFTRIRDAVLKLVGKMTPRDAAAREVLEWLRKTEAEPAKKLNPKKAAVAETLASVDAGTLESDIIDHLNAKHAKPTKKLNPRKKPPAAPAAETTKKIGFNNRGQTLVEDENGVRSTVEGGVRITEPVSIRPTRSGVESYVENRGDQYRTREEIAAQARPADTQAALDAARAEAKKFADLVRTKLYSNPADPELLAAAAKMTVAYTKAGVLTFRDFANQVAETIGHDITRKAERYLRDAWDYVQERFPDAKMDRSNDLASVLGESSGQPQTEPIGRPGDLPGSGVEHDSGQPGADAPAVSSDATPQRDAQESSEGPAGSVREDAPAAGRSEPAGTVRESQGDGASGSADASEPKLAGRGASKRRGAKPATDVQAESGVESEAPQNHAIQPGDDLAVRSEVESLRRNLAAIKLLKQLEDENRIATVDEQKTLAQYTGWGGLSQAFDRYKGEAMEEKRHYGRDQNWEKKWGDAYLTLKNLLSKEEWERARDSTINAHYTSKQVIQKMWKLAEHLGFEGGKVFEPGAGIGHFNGLVPDDIRNRTKFSLVEIDSLSSRLLKKLYPQSDVHAMGIEDFRASPGSFDLAIGNVPFAANGPADGKKRYGINLNLHNYAIARALDAIRPGGMAMLISTHHTLDSSLEQRKFLAGKADLIGAIRLPNNAFEENAKTEVVTDILVFRKPIGGESMGESFEHTKAHPTLGKDASVNEYFIEHPEMILGKEAMTGTMYGKNQYNVEPTPGDLASKLDAAIEKMPAAVFANRGFSEHEATADSIDDIAYGTTEGSFGLTDDGKVQVVSGGKWITLSAMKKIEGLPSNLFGKTGIQRAKDYIALRDAYRDVRRAMLNPESTDEDIAAAQKQMGKVYDKYISKHDNLGRAKTNIFKSDSEYYRVRSLEDTKIRQDPETNRLLYEYTKAPVFSRRTLGPRRAPERVETAKDGLWVSLGYRGKVDPEYIATLTGKTADEITSELLRDGLAFRDPGTQEMVIREKYLSGNVRQKLREAEVAAEDDPSYQSNVDALKAIQPERVGIAKVNVRLGANWLPENVVTHFVRQLFKDQSASATYSPQGDSWTVNVNRHGVAVAQEFAVKAQDNSTYDGKAILENALNLRTPRVTYGVADTNAEGKPITRQVYDEKASTGAKAIASRMQSEFRKLVDSNDKIAAILEDIYNERFNAFVDAKYDGSHIDLPGSSSDVSLRPYQKNAIWRILQDGKALLAHAVGAGKTYTMIGAAMEMRRLGLAKRPILVVQNATLGQFATSFLKMYPNANVLVATKDDLGSDNRQLFLSRVTSGDWDAIVMAQSSLDRLASHPDTERGFIGNMMAELEEAIREEGGERTKTPTVKELVKARKSLEKQMDKLLANEQKNRGKNLIHFEDLDADALFIDEAHAYKKPFFVTKLENLVGLNKQASARGVSTMMKVRTIQARNKGRNVILATGTPITNTLGEAWHMVNFVDPKLNEDFGVGTFDGFIGAFAVKDTTVDMNAGGQWVPKDALVKFTNGPELLRYIRASWDILSPDDLKGYMVGADSALPVLRTGKVQAVTVDTTPGMEKFTDFLERLYAKFKDLPAKERRLLSYIPAVAYGAAKAAALDIRLIFPSARDEKGSKIDRATEFIFQEYDRSSESKGTQLVFSDIFNPRSMARLNEFMEGEKVDFGDLLSTQASSDESEDAEREAELNSFLFSDLKKKLIAAGIPANEIALVAEAKTDAQREALFERVNAGDIRVLLGTSARMGIGVNVQKKLVALHHLDSPWLPADLEQREGRIIRFGNENREVSIYRYAMKRTLDGAIFAKTARKAKFIWQVMSGKLEGREFEDPASEFTMSVEEQLAAINDDPLLFEKMDAVRIKRELELEKEADSDAKARSREYIRDYEREVKRLEETSIPDQQKRIADATELSKSPKDVVINGKKFSKAKDVDEAVAKLLEKHTKEIEKLTVGGQLKEFAPTRLNALSRPENLSEPFEVGGYIAHFATGYEQRMRDGKPVWESVTQATLSSPSDQKINIYDGSATTGTGLLKAVESIPTRLNTALEQLNERLEKRKKEIVESKELLTREWPGQQKLDETTSRLEKIEQELIAKGTEKAKARGDERKQREQSDSGGGAGFFAAKAGAARRQSVDPQDAVITKGIATTLKPVPLVELTKAVRELLGGNMPQVAKRMKALGYFNPAGGKGVARIRIRADQAEDYQSLAGVLAHEAGHLIDYLPDETLKRGNIFGRLATLRSYLRHSIRTPGGTILQKKEIQKELIKLSKWWRGPISKDQQKYRKSSRELYADALSVLLNSPGDLQRRAPKFFNAFIEYMEKKPKVRDAYLNVQDLLNGTSEELAETRRKDIREAYGRGEEIWKARQAEIETGRQSAYEFLQQTLFDTAAPVLTREQKAAVPWDESQAAKHALEELAMSRNALHLWAKKVAKITDTLTGIGVDRLAIGEYMMMRRIAEGDRGGAAEKAQKIIMEMTGKDNWQDAKAEFMATMTDANAQELLDQAMSAKINPQGYSPESAREYLESLKKSLGAKNYKVLEGGVSLLHEAGWENVLEAAKVGSYNREMVRETLTPNKDHYAPFLVLKYLDAKVKAGIFKQVGTFEDIANPFDAFLMKNLSLIRLNELQKAKKEVIKVLESSGELGPKQTVDRFHRLRPPASGKEHLMILEDGKLAAYEVDPYIARVFQSNDIGTLGRLAKWLSGSYRIFHPLWIGFSLGWQASNLVRDPFRTYVNAAVLRSDQSVPRQMLGAVADLGRVPWNYIKAIPPSWRRGFGWDDALIDEMEEERAITTPFVKQRPDDDMDQYDKILMQTGVWEPEKRNAALRAIGSITDQVENLGTFTETLSKVVMYNMAKKKGFKSKERSYLVRTYAGTPNTRRRGLWVNMHNSVWMYSNVIMQGYRADAEVAFNPTTATGRWIRSGLTQYMPKAIMIAAAAGLFGEWLKELFDDISEHDKTKGIIIPLGRSGGKPVYFRLPHNDTDRIVAGIAWKMSQGEGFDGVGEAIDLASGDLPGLNPVIQQSSKWTQFLSGRNPRDDFRGRDILSQDEQKAGGWSRLKPMLLWTTDQYGEPGRAVRAIAEWNRNTFTGEETTTTEKIVNTTPGLSRLLRVSDRGSTEQQWDAVEKEDRDAAKLRLSMPQSVRDLNKERNRLIRLGPERLEESDRGRLAILNAWESGVYQPSREKIKANDNEADRKALESDTKQVVDSLDNRSAKLPEAILGTLVDHLTDPEPRRKLGEKRELYDARRKQHQETIALAAEALHSTGSTDATALRRALLALQKKRGHSTSTIEPNGNSTALGDRLNRIRQRLHAPIAVK